MPNALTPVELLEHGTTERLDIEHALKRRAVAMIAPGLVKLQPTVEQWHR